MGGMGDSMQNNPGLWLQGLGSAATIAGLPQVGGAANLAGSVADYSTVGKNQDAYTAAKVKQENKQPLSADEQKTLAGGAPRTQADVAKNMMGNANQLAAQRQEARKQQMQAGQVKTPQAMPIQQGRGGSVLRAAGDEGKMTAANHPRHS